LIKELALDNTVCHKSYQCCVLR